MLKVAVLTRRGSGRAINQDRVVVNDTVVDSGHPTTVVFTVEPSSVIAVLDGLSPQTILNIRNGKSWPDLRTIARLESVLRTRLWGMEHRKPYADHFN